MKKLMKLNLGGLFEFETPGALGQSFMIPLRGSEKIGYAVNKGRGMMDYWNVVDPPLEDRNAGFG